MRYCKKVGLNHYQQYILGQIGIDYYTLRTASANTQTNDNSNDNKTTNPKIDNINQNQNSKFEKEININPVKIKSLNTLPDKAMEVAKSSAFINSDINHKNPSSWDELVQSINACKKCELCKDRKQPVIGVGDKNPDWLFVGEAPGAEEDLQGLPFVGNSGKLLDNALLSVGLKRGEKLYIANAIKCRPPSNRPPSVNELMACQNYLQAQITLLAPKIIVAVGKSAAIALIGDDKTPLGKFRGRVFKYQNPNKMNEIPIVVTYHPSYLLRNLTDKLLAWEDLVFAIKTLAEKSI